MVLVDRLMLLLRALKPLATPPVNVELEDRLDAVDRRLDRLMVAQYRKAEAREHR